MTGCKMTYEPITMCTSVRKVGAMAIMWCRTIVLYLTTVMQSLGTCRHSMYACVSCPGKSSILPLPLPWTWRWCEYPEDDVTASADVQSGARFPERPVKQTNSAQVCEWIPFPFPLSTLPVYLRRHVTFANIWPRGAQTTRLRSADSSPLLTYQHLRGRVPPHVRHPRF